MANRKKTIDELEAFRSYVSAMGGELLVPTNEYELVRFRGNGVTSIIYTKASGSRTFTGQAWEVWSAWKENKTFRLAAATKRKAGYHMQPIDGAIIKRDGENCFYCGDPFQPDGPKRRTREHLVSATHGGPNHIANMFHACEECNLRAGQMSAPEKIRMRDQLRAEKRAAA